MKVLAKNVYSILKDEDVYILVATTRLFASKQNNISSL